MAEMWSGSAKQRATSKHAAGFAGSSSGPPRTRRRSNRVRLRSRSSAGRRGKDQPAMTAIFGTFYSPLLQARAYNIIGRIRWRSRSLPLDFVPCVCPHDCPSACALEVERSDVAGAHRAGARRRGAELHAGVVCAKVARYAERQHHPERLSVPLRRVGEKGVGSGGLRADLLGRRRSTRWPNS